MNLGLLISTMIISILADGSTYTSARWIMVRYSKLGDKYLKEFKHSSKFLQVVTKWQRSDPGGELPSYLWLVDLDKTQRRELCLEISTATIFQKLKYNQAWPQRTSDVSNEELISGVEHFYQSSLLSTFHKFLLTVKINENIITVDAIPCSIDETQSNSWFLTVGFDQDSLMVLVKKRDYPHYVITGLAEPSPILNQVYLNDQTLLEKTFLNNLKTEGLLQKRNICGLDFIQRYRLCSGVFTIWKHETDPEKLYPINHVKSHRFESLCMENAPLAITLTNEKETLSEPVKVDLLPCAVNQEWFSPDKFYVTADPVLWDAVYVLEDYVPYSSNQSDSSESGGSNLKGKKARKVKFVLPTDERKDDSTRESRMKQYTLRAHVRGVNVLRYKYLLAT